MYKRMSGKILSVVSTLVIAVFALVPATGVSAHSRGSSTGSPIRSGLWQGVNLSLGGNTTRSNTSGTTNTSTRTRSTAAPDPVPATAGAYVALGDSVAAGLGLTPKVQVPAAETRCGRTSQAYPYTVALTMGLPLIHIACSGATAGDLVTKQRSGSPNLPAQLTTAFAGGTPGLITITAGANDAHWLGFLRTCYTTDCSTRTSTTLANAYLTAMQFKLYYALGSIQYRSNNQPPAVVVTGYYNPVSTACTTFTQNVTAEEITWLTAEINALNQTIQNVAARYSFVRFAPVDFTGHDVCSAQPWVQGLNSPAPFHPTSEGQVVITRSVLAALGR